MTSSAIPKFFAKSREERLNILKEFSNLSSEDIDVLNDIDGGVSFERADKMIENTIGTFSLPLGTATNFTVNGRDHLIPMAIEEPSIIAAASKAAKTARSHGGFTVTADESYSIGQIQLIGVNSTAINQIQEHTDEILCLANSKSSTLSKLGRGAKEIQCKEIATPSGTMLIVEIIIDVGDAMGANITNTMCEAISPLLEEITGSRSLLRILSNYSTRRMVRASAVFSNDLVGGKDVVNDIILAYEFADNDVYRAVTHNKGVMNGIIAVANAIGQDSRAIEAAAHAYAAHTGRYRSLTQWSCDDLGNLVGKLEIPLAVGIVGGVANVHPVAKVCAKILGVNSAHDLGCVMAAAGLAQNYAALRALATDGIQKGHMKLHVRNLAAAAGATPDQIDDISKIMIEQGNISLDTAKKLVSDIN